MLAGLNIANCKLLAGLNCAAAFTALGNAVLWVWVAAVSGTFMAIALIGTGPTIAYNLGIIENMPYLDAFSDAAPMLLGLLVLGLIYIPSVRNYQPPAGLAVLFSWRILAAVITVSFVSVFQFIMADNVLYMIWPEAALFEWIGREIWTPLFG